MKNHICPSALASGSNEGDAHNCELRLAKWGTRKHLLEVEAGRHLMGEADLLHAEWAEME